MPLPDLLAALERDAGAQTEAILAAARAEAERVASETEARVAGQRAAARATTEAAHRGELERDLARVRREAQARVLAARTRLLDRVNRAVQQLLPGAISQPGYLETLGAAMREATAGVGDAPAEIHCTPSLVAPVRRLVAGRAHTAVTADAGVGSGFRLRTTDGAVEIDATLESRLARERVPLALAALALLEPDR